MRHGVLRDASMATVTPFAPDAPLRIRRRGAAIALTVLAVVGITCGDTMEAPFGTPDTIPPATTTAAGSTVATTPTTGGVVATTLAGAGGDGGDGGAAPSTTLPGAPLQGLALEVLATGLHQPTVIAAPVGDTRVFAAERFGVIRTIDPESGLSDEPFLDLRDRVGSNGIEQGLLGLAFHPDYASNGRLFVYYVDGSGNRQLSEFAVSDDPGRADHDSERVLFELPQPAGSVDIRHYAGAVQFGPDGMLYVSLGDGADARNQGQNPDTLYAAIVRLDVDSGDPYAIPPDNPFVAGGGAPEVWAYGLRNPWRFAIDHEAELLYVADVGQANWEEVSVVPLAGGGYNFGWPITEGTRCFTDSDCDTTGLTMPVLEYDHSNRSCSITGGSVYRGRAIPEIAGHYFYADWCGLWVRSFRYADGVVSDEQDWSEDLAAAGQVNSFGVDGFGELYIANFEGTIARIVPVR